MYSILLYYDAHLSILNRLHSVDSRQSSAIPRQQTVKGGIEAPVLFHPLTNRCSVHVICTTAILELSQVETAF